MIERSYPVDTYEPLSLMPAEPGWRAVYWLEGGDVIGLPLVMWAVCRRTTSWYREGVKTPRRSEVRRVVCGLVNDRELGLDAPEPTSNFLGYAEPGADMTECYGERAAFMWADEQRSKVQSATEMAPPSPA